MSKNLLQAPDAVEIRIPDPDSQFRLRACPRCRSDNAAYVLRRIGSKRLWQCERQDCGHTEGPARTRHDAQGLWNWGTLEAGA